MEGGARGRGEDTSGRNYKLWEGGSRGLLLKSINDMYKKCFELSCQHQTPGLAHLCERHPMTENCTKATLKQRR